MTTDTNNSKHIIAEEGKVFKRVSDGVIFGAEIFLGFTYYIDGVLLKEPLEELPKHFEEVINKAPMWDLSDEEFLAKVEAEDIIKDEESGLWKYTEGYTSYEEVSN